MAFKARGVDMAKLGAALTAFALGGDVNIAASTGANAAENNALFLISLVAVAAYTSYVSVQEGGLYEGLQAIGRGDDPLSQAMGDATAKAVEWAGSEFPEETQKAAAVLNAVGEKIASGVQVVMETPTGEQVTAYWNELSEQQQNAIIGGASVVSMVIPASVVSKLQALSDLPPEIELNDWVSNPNAPEWDRVPSESKQLLLAPPAAVGVDIDQDKLILPTFDPGTAQSRINLSKETWDPATSLDSNFKGLDYALDKHGSNSQYGDNKSKFSISDQSVKELLQRSDVVSAPVYNQIGFDGEVVDYKFIRQVDVGQIIGQTPVPAGGTSNTSLITIITNERGDIINVFPGSI